MVRPICNYILICTRLFKKTFVFALMYSNTIYIIGCNLELSEKNSGECVPDCVSSSNQCLDDGCGSVCPCKNPNEVCSANPAEDGACVPEDACDPTAACEERQCGTVCGVSCGTCDDGKRCVGGRCECAPECDGIHCGQDDGCGGECKCASGICVDGLCVDGEDPCLGKQCGTWNGKDCGTCEGEDLCNAAGKCVADCDDVCGDVGWQCGGTICHDECGPCDENEMCDNHTCRCEPRCPDGYCGDNGCGESCGCETGFMCDKDKETCIECGDLSRVCDGVECGEVCGVPCGNLDGDCPESEVCMDGLCQAAALKMELVSGEVFASDGKYHGTLQIDYMPRSTDTHPRIADLRINTNRSVDFEVDSISLGVAGTLADKIPYIDPISLKPWRYRPDGSVQVLVHTDLSDIAHADKRFEQGTLLIVNFVCDLKDDDPTTGIKENQVSISLVKRNQVFAPFEADLALQETAYDTAVVVTK